MSGITLSRSAYLGVLETLMPTIESAVGEARKRNCSLNLFAGPMSLGSLDQLGEQPGRRVWCLVLESTVLPLRVKETVAEIAQVWVPTQFVYDVCINNGLPADKLRLVPYYMHRPTRPRIEPGPNDPFTVLTSWDAKSSMNRKNIVGTINAFRRAFPDDKGVRLRLKTRDATKEHRDAIRVATEGDTRIELWDQTTPTVDEIYDGAHVLLHLHRAEGFGRHIIEAQMRRLPVIATGYSGCMDWLTPDNALLVRYELVDTAQQEFQYPQGGKWARPSQGHAAAQLIHCRAHYDTMMRAIVDNAERDALAFTSFDRSRNAMAAALDSLGLPHAQLSPDASKVA